MPTFLSDPPFSLYAILALAAIVCGFVWINKRSRSTLVIFGCFLLAVLLLFLIDRLFESPREEAVRRINAMANAIDSRNKEAFLSHIADSFLYENESGQVTITREALRNSPMWSYLNQYSVKHVAAWGFSRDDVATIDDNTIEIGFLGKAETDSNQIPMYFRARFTRQTDGQMKLTGLASFEAVRTNERKSIPNFP
jgi:hypothetical protein